MSSCNCSMEEQYLPINLKVAQWQNTRLIISRLRVWVHPLLLAPGEGKFQIKSKQRFCQDTRYLWVMVSWVFTQIHKKVTEIIIFCNLSFIPDFINNFFHISITPNSIKLQWSSLSPPLSLLFSWQASAYPSKPPYGTPFYSTLAKYLQARLEPILVVFLTVPNLSVGILSEHIRLGWKWETL